MATKTSKTDNASTNASTNSMSLETFRETLNLIVRGHKEERKAVTLVFVACINDLFHSKSVDRLNMAAQQLAALPFWNEFVKQARRAYGGLIIDDDLSGATDDVRMSPLHFIAKHNGFIRQDIPEERFRKAMQFWDSKLSGMLWNEFQPAKPEQKKLISAKEIQTFFAKISKNSDAWQASDRETIQRVIDSVSGIFD